MLMCGGDGLADILGRKWGTRRIPWNRAKSYAGFLACSWVAGYAQILVVWIFYLAGVFSQPIQAYLCPLH